MRFPFRALIAFTVWAGIAAYPMSAQRQPTTPPEKPALVVSIVVDQMRYDYLQKFWPQFGPDGFRRLASEGFRFDNCHYNYIPTETAPGHATIHTGTTPSVHGIIANVWFDRELGGAHSSVADASHPRVGEGAHKGASPQYLRVTTIADEIKASTNYRGKSVGLSLKDRSAILPIGKSGDLALWFDEVSGQWISSTYYLKQGEGLPEWVTEINNSNLAETFLSKGWALLKPASAYLNSDAPSDVRYEGLYYPDSACTFPYRFKTQPFQVVKSGAVETVLPGAVLRATPHGNTILEDLAEAAILNMDLGADAHTDFLCVSFSSPDVIGHQFGPQSREVEDTYLRLDLEIAALLSFLDSHLKGKVLVTLTADHGAAENPLYARDHGHDADFLKADGEVHAYLESELGANWVQSVQGHNVYLNYAAIQRDGADPEKVAWQAVQALKKMPQVFSVFTAAELFQLPPSNEAERALRNGYFPGRSGDVLFVTTPGYTDSGYDRSWSSQKGTSHGSPWDYDKHVPLLFWGKGILSGKSAVPAFVPDIAPSLSALLGIQSPSGTSGVSLTGHMQ